MERFSQSFIKINYDKKIRLILIRISLIIHAADRNRTGTGITTHGILSPGRLPVPPLRQNDPEETRTLDLRRDRAAL